MAKNHKKRQHPTKASPSNALLPAEPVLIDQTAPPPDQPEGTRPGGSAGGASTPSPNEPVALHTEDGAAATPYPNFVEPHMRPVEAPRPTQFADQPAFCELKEMLQRKPVVAWTGAGLSKPGGMPDWHGLYTQVVKALARKTQTLEPGSEIRALANKLASELDSGTQIDYWDRFGILRNVFTGAGADRAAPNDYYKEAIQGMFAPSCGESPMPAGYTKLWKAGVRGMVTMNLDDFPARSLGAAFFGQATRCLTPLDPGVNFDISHELTRPFVAYMHGEFRNELTWVFTADERNRLLAKRHYRKIINYLLRNSSLLFVGVTATDVAIQAHLAALAREIAQEATNGSPVRTGPHFWITHKVDDELARWAEKHKIRVIVYNKLVGKPHSELYRLLDELHPDHKFSFEWETGPIGIGEVVKEGEDGLSIQDRLKPGGVATRDRSPPHMPDPAVRSRLRLVDGELLLYANPALHPVGAARRDRRNAVGEVRVPDKGEVDVMESHDTVAGARKYHLNARRAGEQVFVHVTDGQLSAPAGVPPQGDHVQVGPGMYLRLCSEGYCIDPPQEGAFGLVLNLYNQSKAIATKVLKLPRLYAHTFPENMIIAEKLESEVRALAQIEGHCGKLPAGDGAVIGCHDLNLLRSAFEPLDGVRGVLVVRYDPHRGPQFRCIYFYHDPNTNTLKLCPNERIPVSGYPAPFDCKPGRVLAEAGQKSIMEVIEYHAGHARRSGVLQILNPDNPTRQQRAQLGSVPLEDFRLIDDSGQIWYAGLPSLIVDRAHATLQQDLMTGALEHWSVVEIVSLVGHVLSGLDYLHAAQVIHGDIRPSNIMRTTADLEPGYKHYRIIDFGSFSDEAAPPATTVSGYTVGPLMGGGRASVFYSSERRAAEVREDADTAFVWLDGDSLVVYLDWRSRLSQESRGAAVNKEALIAKLKAAEGMPHEHNDYLRIRDHAAPIIRHKPRVDSEDFEVFWCDWEGLRRVMHDKVLVRELNFTDKTDLGGGIADSKKAGERYNEFKAVLEAGHLMGIPQITIVRQWSAATDMFSVGVLLLYMLFTRRTADPSKVPLNQQNREAIEKHFREMLETLESESALQTIWPALHAFYAKLRAELLTAAAVGYQTVAAADPPSVPEHDARDGASFTESASDLVTQLALSIPHFDRIIRACERNAAAVILLVHFSLCCIHRRSALQPDTPGCGKIFSETRSDKPVAKGPASTALDELMCLTPILQNLYAAGQVDASEPAPFVIPEDVTIKPYDANSQFNNGPKLAEYEKIKLRWDDLQIEIKRHAEIVRKNQELDNQLRQREAELQELKPLRDQLTRLANDVRELIIGLERSVSAQVLGSVSDPIKQVLAQIGSANNKLDTSAASARELVEIVKNIKQNTEKPTKR